MQFKFSLVYNFTPDIYFFLFWFYLFIFLHNNARWTQYIMDDFLFSHIYIKICVARNYFFFQVDYWFLSKIYKINEVTPIFWGGSSSLFSLFGLNKFFLFLSRKSELFQMNCLDLQGKPSHTKFILRAQPPPKTQSLYFLFEF
jgi:type IV secretory pathway VirB3-like protein